jgi:large-conductance mechanosensitive channel
LVEVEIVDIKKVELIALILPLINTAMTTFTERGVHIALDKRMTSLQGKMMDYDTRLMKIANFLIIAEGEEILWPMNLVKSNM